MKLGIVEGRIGTPWRFIKAKRMQYKEEGEFVKKGKAI
jgi:hypothetical protein